MSHTFNLPPGLLSSVCYVESHHNPAAINLDDGTGASIGICQIHYATAAQMGYKGTVAGLKDPEINIFWASVYLHHQLYRYNGNWTKAVAAYNAGSFRLNEKGQIKNRQYVAKVMKAWKEHR